MNEQKVKTNKHHDEYSKYSKLQLSKLLHNECTYYRACRIDRIKTLLELGADPNYLDASGNTTYAYALSWEDEEVHKLLKEAGGDKSIGKRTGNQAEDGIRDFCLSRGLGDVYKRQVII